MPFILTHFLYQLNNSGIPCNPFLIVKSAGATYFTKSGALNVDQNGTLYCTTNGATVQGWMYDETLGDVKKDVVKDLTVMSAENMYYEGEFEQSYRVSGSSLAKINNHHAKK